MKLLFLFALVATVALEAGVVAVPVEGPGINFMKLFGQILTLKILDKLPPKSNGYI
jgi:hypothetical protein